MPCTRATDLMLAVAGHEYVVTGLLLQAHGAAEERGGGRAGGALGRAHGSAPAGPMTGDGPSFCVMS